MSLNNTKTQPSFFIDLQILHSFFHKSRFFSVVGYYSQNSANVVNGLYALCCGIDISGQQTPEITWASRVEFCSYTWKVKWRDPRRDPAIGTANSSNKLLCLSKTSQ